MASVRHSGTKAILITGRLSLLKGWTGDDGWLIEVCDRLHAANLLQDIDLVSGN